MSPRLPVIGQTRTTVQPDHALIGPDSHVLAPLPGWDAAEGVTLISPRIGAAPRCPGFVQTLATLTASSVTRAAAPGIQRLVYVLSGQITLDGQAIAADGFAYLPADSAYELRGSADTTLLIFEKPYVAVDGIDAPPLVTGTWQDAPAEPFMGDPATSLATLLPTGAAFDMAVNVFTFQPGAALPFVETHVMEHGLYMHRGAGVYRLGESWYPVTAGDAIWMAPYCPQWFVAMGPDPATYIYFKDVNRAYL